jgi:3-deoxy-D-manno-octulosonic-acid transferase
MVRLIYNFLWPVGLILFLPGYVMKMLRRGGYRRNFGQRLGLYSSEVLRRRRGSRPIWIHAVSVGEVRLGIKLATQLEKLGPGRRFILTTTTTTGYMLAEKLAFANMDVLYSPLDFWPVMRRAWRVIDPKCVVLIEAEVWPNLVSEAVRRRVPVVLANARLSPRSESRFRRFRAVIGPFLRKLELVCVSTSEDAARWTCLGVAPDRIKIVGSIKYDTEEQNVVSSEPRQVLEKLGVDLSRPVLFGGSTHHGEEEALAEVFCSLRQQYPSLFLVIAPRHVERAGEVEEQLRKCGLNVVRRSNWLNGAEKIDALLLDTTGELGDWYSVASAVFIGKSLTAHGGQNPVEAINAGKPVIFGPHMENFSQLAGELVATGAALRVETAEQMADTCSQLLNDSALREQMGAAAWAVIRRHLGATQRTAELIAETLRIRGKS